MDISLSNINPNELIDIESLRKVLIDVLNILEEQQQEIIRLKQENQKLKDENNRLKGEQGKPEFKPNTKPTKKDISAGGMEKRKTNWSKQAKKPIIPIDHTEICQLDKSELPHDAEFKYYDDVMSQGIIFERKNILYKAAVYYSPLEKKTYRAPLPDEYTGYFNSELKSFILLMYNVCDVTSKKLLTLLHSKGIEISAGSLSNILLSNLSWLEEEKNAILKAGLSLYYSQTDITGARVCGRNHYVHIITNPLFTFYSTLRGKSLLDVLAAFQGLANKTELQLLYNNEAQQLLEAAKISLKDRESLIDLLTEGQILSLPEFEKYINEQLPELYNKPNMFIKAKQVLALAFYHNQSEIPVVKRLVSDEAPEYNKISTEAHALCWVHDARHYKKLTPFIKVHQDILSDFKNKYWEYYGELLDYKDNPFPKGYIRTKELAGELERKFDELFTLNTNYFQLNQRIEKTYKNKKQLLVVLDHPEIPLHNNLSELGARRQVRKRDISLHTMTIKGTKVKDAWMTIVQTAIQLGIDVNKYILDHINDSCEKFSLANVIYKKAFDSS